MEIILIALATTITAASFFVGVPKVWIRRLLGYLVIFNLVMHITVVTITSQFNSAIFASGELTAILLSIALYFMHKALGHERLVRRTEVPCTRWVRQGFKLVKTEAMRPGRFYERRWESTPGWFNKS